MSALAGRGLLISFLDNVYHYETPVNDVFFAKNLRLAKPLQGILLNFNLHGIHHIGLLGEEGVAEIGIVAQRACKTSQPPTHRRTDTVIGSADRRN